MLRSLKTARTVVGCAMNDSLARAICVVIHNHEQQRLRQREQKLLAEGKSCDYAYCTGMHDALVSLRVELQDKGLWHENMDGK
jgi:hypothetical protein